MLRKPARKPHGICKLASAEVCGCGCTNVQDADKHIVVVMVGSRLTDILVLIMQETANQTQDSHKLTGINGDVTEVNSTKEGVARKPSVDKIDEASHVKNASQGDIPFSGPLQVSTSSGFAWAKRRKDDASIRSHSRSISRGHFYSIGEATAALESRTKVDSKRHENGDVISGARLNCRCHDSYEIVKLAMQNNWSKFDRPDSFDASDEYHSQELSLAQYEREEMAAKRSNMVSLSLSETDVI